MAKKTAKKKTAKKSATKKKAVKKRPAKKTAAEVTKAATKTAATKTAAKATKAAKAKPRKSRAKKGAPKRARARKVARPKPVRVLEADVAIDVETQTATKTDLLAETEALFRVEARSHFELLELERVRRSLRAIQGKVAKQMEKILNNQNLTLSGIKLPQEDNDPIEPPLMRLRRYMSRLQDVRRRLDGPGFGICEVCHVPLNLERLVDVPWLTRCAGCGAKDVRHSALDAYVVR